MGHVQICHTTRTPAPTEPGHAPPPPSTPVPSCCPPSPGSLGLAVGLRHVLCLKQRQLKLGPLCLTRFRVLSKVLFVFKFPSLDNERSVVGVLTFFFLLMMPGSKDASVSVVPVVVAPLRAAQPRSLAVTTGRRV